MVWVRKLVLLLIRGNLPQGFQNIWTPMLSVFNTKDQVAILCRRQSNPLVMKFVAFAPWTFPSTLPLEAELGAYLTLLTKNQGV